MMPQRHATTRNDTQRHATTRNDTPENTERTRPAAPQHPVSERLCQEPWGPDEYMAETVIYLATELGVQVTGKLIAGSYSPGMSG